MKNLYKENGRWEVYGGSQIVPTLIEAKEMATPQEGVSFDFNGITITVAHDSDLESLGREFNRAISRYIKGPIGPYPKPLTDGERENDARIAAENAARLAKVQEEYDQKQNVKRKAMNERLAGAPVIELRDIDAWEKNKAANSDPYGSAVIEYAEIWARLMQAEMAAGKKIAEIAEPTSRDADIDGITGFMYGCAVLILAQCWKHGEALRFWHNKTTQIGTEGDAANESGGVLNPALLTLSSKS